MGDRSAAAGAARYSPHQGPRALRAPAVMLALALSAGILCDRLCNPDFIFWIWAAAPITAMLIVSRLFRMSLTGTLGIVLLWVCLGGMRHHWVWSIRHSSDVARFATDEQQPAELIGVLATPVQFHVPDDDPFTPPWMRVVRSTCVISSERLITGGRNVEVSGRVRLEVSGRLPHPRVGDRVRIVGRLLLPAGPKNPGGFDFRAYLRDERIDCLLRTSHPDAVTVLPDRPGWLARMARVRHVLREKCRLILRRELAPEHVPLATSLLLGDRTEMTDELRTAFVESGTMHLLAISGLHVGILAGLVFVVCRLLNTGPVGTGMTVLLLVWLYAFVTDHRPPVLRASVLVTIVMVGSLLTRVINNRNALAVSAVVILLYSPTDLFDTGAQLSFLAVAAMLWSARIEGMWLNADQPDDPLQSEPGPIRQFLALPMRWLRGGYLMTASIWLFTLPLIMFRFHLASPVGFLLNVVLIPFVAVTLGIGFLLLFSGILLPPLAPAAGVVFDFCLGLLLSVAEGSAGWGPGHLYVGGPPAWWLIGFYFGLAIATRLIVVPGRSHRAWQALAVWTIIGLGIGLLPTRRNGITCTFLAMGHGGGILLECPNGRTVLYDAGTFGSGRQAQQIVQEALWARGLYKLDAVVISHADVDHFNGLAGLLETVRIDQILINRSFLDFEQRSVAAVCDAAARHGVGIRLIQTGDGLRLHPGVDMRVLHPAGDVTGNADNENSIVLQIRYASRSILLTGDLEGAGLQQLLQTPSHDVDVMLAPHHGSRAANPTALADWAQPEFVVISTDDFGVADRLSAVYGTDCRVLSTAESGAVTIDVSAHGEMDVREFCNVSE